MESSTKIRIAHSPDSDDAFMFYALTQGLVDTGGLEVEHHLDDIIFRNESEISPISLRVLPLIASESIEPVACIMEHLLTLIPTRSTRPLSSRPN